MGKISTSIKKIYGISENKHKDFMKKYSLDDVDISVKGIKSWESVPENVAKAFEMEFGHDITLLHECFKRDYSMKELDETVSEVTSINPSITIDEVFKMIIEADDKVSGNDYQMYPPEGENSLSSIILQKENNLVSVNEVLSILDTSSYNDLRIDSLCYQRFGIGMDEEVKVPVDDIPNFMTMIMQITNMVGDVSEGSIVAMVSYHGHGDNDRAAFQFEFEFDNTYSYCTFNSTQAFFFIEEPQNVSNIVALTVKAKSVINTVEVADGLDGTKVVPAEYMGGWVCDGIDFNGTFSDFPASIDSTDFSNDMELIAVSESVRYLETEAFTSNNIPDNGDGGGFPELNF